MGFGSIYIGLSGLSAYSKGLQVVSNNISNMNTLGYKASGVSFGDVYGLGSSGGLDYGNYAGGGHGVSVNDVAINFNQGELRQTGRDLDLSIDGNGFFVLLDGENTLYTRTGSFAVADDGFIVLQGTDYRLGVLDDAGRAVALNIDQNRMNPPEATDRITFALNLSSSANSNVESDLKVYDALGTEHTWTINFSKAEGSSVWNVKVTDGNGVEVDPKPTDAPRELKYSNVDGTVDPTTRELVIEDAAKGLRVVLDFSNTAGNSSGTVSTLEAKANGHPLGSIATLRVNQEGQVEIAYTNNEKKQLGAIALADFRDPQSLEQRSKALFAFTGFGQRQLLAASDSRVGTILGGQLEASNVDLGSQFGDLILIQRGFQASSQVISVSNDMIQQLFGIRGQG
jgi:flagellar hook protein FlgE